MPELPEVETARGLIADQALHRPIVDVDDSDSYVGRPHSPGELRSALKGRSLIAAHRRGKTIWLETSGTGDAAAPGGPEIGIHLGMSGRIVVTGPDGSVAEGGDPRRYEARPRKAEWNRFTLMFADGGSLVLLDPRRLGRVRLNPDIGALGPDAAQVTPAEFRGLITKGTIAVKARLLDQSKIAGVGNLLADEILWQARVSPLARVEQSLFCAGQSPLPRAKVGPGVRQRQGRRAHRRRYRGPPSGRHLPAGRRPDGARNGRRTLHLVVLARAGPPARPAEPGSGRRSAPHLWAHQGDPSKVTSGVASRGDGGSRRGRYGLRGLGADPALGRRYDRDSAGHPAWSVRVAVGGSIVLSPGWA